MQGKIYKITNDINALVYVGSTTRTLARRMNNHRTTARKEGKSALWRAMRELGIDHFKIELVEEFECNTKEELRIREQYWIGQLDTLQNGYNKYFACQSEEQKIARAGRHARYQERNRELINQRRKERRLADNSKDVAYRILHREHCLQYGKEYRQLKKQQRHIAKLFAELPEYVQ